MIKSSSTNGLALLAFKCASRVFDISSGLTQVSIRDQIVRAQLFVDDLCAKAPKPKAKLLVIGAGIAGVSAALRAKEKGLEVVLLDAQKAPFSLLANVTVRYVGPFMYEWPMHGSDCQSYPKDFFGEPGISTPSWSSRDPLPASELVKQLRRWLGTLNPASLPEALLGVDPHAVRVFVRQFVASWGSSFLSVPSLQLNGSFHGLDGAVHHKALTFTPDYVVLALGMGAERVTVSEHPSIKGRRFWSNDNFRRGAEFNGTAGVFGGGDGALQDVLRLLTRHEHPLHFIREIENSHPAAGQCIRSQHDQLLALEQQARLISMWAPDHAFGHLDRQCQLICQKLADCDLVRRAVLRQLRKGTGCVHHIWREQTFGKAYLLNRFVLHLLEQCLKARDRRDQAATLHCVRYEPHRGANVVTSRRGARVWRASQKMLRKSPSRLTPARVPMKRKMGATKLGFVHRVRSWVKIDAVDGVLPMTHIAVRYGVEPLKAGQKMVTLTDQQTKDRASMGSIFLPPQLSGAADIY